MALNDIIVAKEGNGGVLAEIALAPADIGAATTESTVAKAKALADEFTGDPALIYTSESGIGWYTLADPASFRTALELSTNGNAAGLYDNTAGQVGAVVNDFSFRINGDGVSADFDTANLTASRAYGLPNASGTIALTNGATNLWIPASAFIPKTTAGCGVDSRETTTNDQNFDELLFDTGSDEFADALVVMPSNYNNGTVTARFYWTASSGSGGVAWAIQGRAFANDDALDTAAGTAQLVTDTLIAANDMHITSATSAVTLGGTPAANTPIQFTIYRDVSDAADTLGVDARLLGVEIIYTAA